MCDVADAGRSPCRRNVPSERLREAGEKRVDGTTPGRSKHACCRSGKCLREILASRTRPVQAERAVVLQIPPQFNKFWLQRDRITGQDLVPRPPADIRTLTPMESVGFVMYLPAFEGFTPQNYQRDFDEERVEVVRIAPAIA